MLGNDTNDKWIFDNMLFRSSSGFEFVFQWIFLGIWNKYYITILIKKKKFEYIFWIQ